MVMLSQKGVDVFVGVGVQTLEVTAPKGNVILTESRQNFHVIAQVCVPLMLVPVKRFAALRVFATRCADLVSIIDRGCADVGELKEQS